MKTNLDDMTHGYITAALWADCQPLCTCGGDVAERMGHDSDCPAEESGGLESLQVDAESWAYVRALVAAFAEAAGDDLEAFAELRELHGFDRWQCVGHDLRLTSCGHGTGFWDREPTLPAVWSHGARRTAFYAARDRLSALASDDRRFSRIGGGDCWQTSEDMATLDPLAFHADPAPGERWQCPALTSAQRQAWIESGIVPDVADTFPVSS
jgi:hypothetical protein